MSWVKFRDANTNFQNEENTSWTTPNTMDGSGWSVATGRGQAQGGAIDRSIGDEGLSGFTIAAAAVAAVVVLYFIRKARS